MPKGPDGRFHNPWPDSEPHGLSDVIRFFRERPSRPRAKAPTRGSFPTAIPAVRHPRAGDHELVVTWIGHSTVLLQAGGLNILTDPVFSQHAFPVQWLAIRRVMDPGLELDALPPIDVVLLSHNHYDHLDRPAVQRLARAHPGAVWIVPLALGRYIRRWGVTSIHELDWWDSVAVGALRVTATPANHFSSRTPFDRNRSLWCGYALATGRHRVLFVGDTAWHPDFGEIGTRCGPFDLVMVPIGAYEPQWFMGRVHVNPDQASRIYAALADAHPAAPRPVMLAIHWGTFLLTEEPMDEPPRRIAECWAAAGRDRELLWIARFGETRAIIARA